MDKIKIGVICPSEIAFRRFMPALQKQSCFEYMGVAYANEQEWFGNSGANSTMLLKEKEKAESFVQTYGGQVFSSYQQMLSNSDINAIYLPLPPALHYKWGKAVLAHGKHLLMEKPFTTDLEETRELLEIAEKNGLAVHENYMFQYHSQLDFIRQTIENGKIGEIRLVRIAFGFPFRGANDFRYSKALGGGALLDCGGYTLKLASLLLGETATVTAAHLNYKTDLDVDVYGNATMKNDSGLTAQLSFGMDNSYKCDLELWGSTGTLHTSRILTAPDNFSPTVQIVTPEHEETHRLEADDTFSKSIVAFEKCIFSTESRLRTYSNIRFQASLMQNFIQKCISDK